MPQKKKKHNQQADQKVMEARHRNDYFKRLSKFCINATGIDILKLLPKHEWKRMYLYRTRYITLLPEIECKVAHELTESMKGSLNYWFKRHSIFLIDISRKVNFSEYYEFCVSLYCLFLWSHKMNCKNAPLVTELLQNDFGDLEIIVKNIYNEIYNFGFVNLIVVNNDFCQNYYTYRVDYAYKQEELRLKFNIFVKPRPIDSIKLSIDGCIRSAYRIGWSYIDEKFEWLGIKPSQLSLNEKEYKETLPVYIQKHALQRLKERLDCIHPAYLHAYVALALRHATILRNGPSFLIEYKLFKEKVGYLSAIVLDGKLVIRTFLFLTCVDTPEGRKLKNLIGLQKLDTTFLKLERLSSFMPAHLKNNDQLCAIFEKVGCLHLLNAHERFDKFSIVHPQHTLLEMIPKYIKIEEETPIVWQTEEDGNDALATAS